MAARPLIFALGASEGFGAAVARHLGTTLATVEERTFEDGEHKLRPLTNVRGRDIYVIHSLAGDAEQSVNDKLCRLLFFIATLRDAGAARVTAVIPYLAYARKDRRTKLHDPVTMRYLGQLFEAMGVHRVIALDVHNVAAFENAFRCETVHLEARWEMARAVMDLAGDLPVAVVSPDSGGAKRADRLRDALEQRMGRPARMVIMEKRRSEGKVSGNAVAGDPGGCLAVIVDDLIAGGTTMVRALRACQERGAVTIVAAASHGLFSKNPDALLQHPGLHSLLVGNTLPWRVEALNRAPLRILPMEPLFAHAIRVLSGRDESGTLDFP